MNWIRVEDALPRDGQAVLVRRINDNHHSDHTLADGSKETIWRWYACTFRRGQTAEEVAITRSISGRDQHGNNHRPYAWETFGAFRMDGQDVSHWCAIEAPEI